MITHVTKTLLHRRGYRKGKTSYYKTRRTRNRQTKTTVHVRLRSHGWYDVLAIEGSTIDFSEMLRGVRQLRQWEAFAFCS